MGPTAGEFWLELEWFLAPTFHNWFGPNTFTAFFSQSRQLGIADTQVDIKIAIDIEARVKHDQSKSISE